MNCCVWILLSSVSSKDTNKNIQTTKRNSRDFISLFFSALCTPTPSQHPGILLQCIKDSALGKSCRKHDAKIFLVTAPQSLWYCLLCSATMVSWRFSPRKQTEVCYSSLLASTLIFPFPKKPEEKRRCCKTRSCISSTLLDPTTWR